ncbi:MAG: hypothetical protein IJI45_03060 [Anaerolineaceae bacterium]|nr:hypothetical protein [Anaerolineaceae bacterium]
MAISDSPMAKMMYRNALMNLSNGIVNPIDKDILSSTPLPDNFIAPYLSEETDAITMMKLGFNSLSTWIEEAKKASYFSKHFVTLSKMIMSGVSTMARGLVTLHARGEDLSQAPMSIQDLIGVGSYHIRKSYLGVLQTSRKDPEIGERLLINQLSWTNTMLRLFKTKEKLESESSNCKVQSSDAKKIETSASPELPVGNDVQAFEPFEGSGEALSPLTPISAPGAYTAPRAYGALRGVRGQDSVVSGQDSVVSGRDSVVSGRENEEGRMKNEVNSETSDSGIQVQGTRGQDGSSDEDNSSFFPHNSSLSPPDYREILFRAMERSEDFEDGEITFTEDEARMLLADPLFCSEEPELAEDIRNALST